MKSNAEYVSRESALAQREEVLASTGLDLETLRDRGERWQLSPEQRWALEEYDNLTWLAGE